MKFLSEQGAKTQKSFVDFKFLQRCAGENLPKSAEVLIVRCCLWIFDFSDTPYFYSAGRNTHSQMHGALV